MRATCLRWRSVVWRRYVRRLRSLLPDAYVVGLVGVLRSVYKLVHGRRSPFSLSMGDWYAGAFSHKFEQAMQHVLSYQPSLEIKASLCIVLCIVPHVQ